MDSCKEGTNSEELPLSNSHEQVQNLWIKIKDRTSKRQALVSATGWLVRESVDTAALLQIHW